MNSLAEKTASQNQNPMSHAELIVPEYDSQEWSDLSTDAIKETFKKHGAILFRGFKGDVDRLAALTDRFCHSYMTNPNADRMPISKEKQINTVNTSHVLFELHAERHQTPLSPDICWFYCNQAPDTIGETTYCDGALLVEHLSKKTRNLLMQKEMWYHGIIPLSDVTGLWDVKTLDELRQVMDEKKLNHIYEINGETVLQRYSVPFLKKSRYSDKPAFVSFLLFSRYMFGQKNYPTFENYELIPDEISDEIRNVGAQLTVYHKWQNTDLLMLDNTRFLHGRNKIDPLSKRDIWTRFGFASF